MIHRLNIRHLIFRDVAGVLAMEVMFFYTMIQMNYGLNLANYDSGFVVVFKLLTTAVSLLFASISFASLYYAPRILPGNRILTIVLYGGIPGRANMRSLAYLGGAVECGMMNAAIHQLAHHIKVPNYNSSGLTDSKIPDAQASWEKAMSTVLAAMGGSNYIHHAAGMLESMLAVAYEQYVIDDEIIGMSCKVLEGIPVDAEHLALEAIEEVGPGGSFIMSPHTMAHMRQEYFDGNGVSDQESREKWVEKGTRDTWTRARDMAIKILAEEEMPCIPADVEKAIREKYNILL